MSRGGSRCRVLTTADMLAEIGEAPAPIARVERRPAGSTMPTVSFDLTSRVRGHVDDVGQTYAFTIRGDAVELQRMLTRERGGFAFRAIPPRHKAPLRAAILAAYRAATAAEVLQ